MLTTALLVVLGLQIKHFLADYVLQTRRMTIEKGDPSLLGGYAHAGVHTAGSLVVFALLIPLSVWVLALLAAEFVVHFGIDYFKVHGSRDVTITGQPKLFWLLHGLDQFMHQLTYLGMVWVIVMLSGG